MGTPFPRDSQVERVAWENTALCIAAAKRTDENPPSCLPNAEFRQYSSLQRPFSDRSDRYRSFAQIGGRCW